MSGGAHPERTCAGCRGKAPQRDLVRVVRSPAGEVTVDTAARSPGRGAYLHRDPACVELARRRRALDRALRCRVPEGLWPELEAVANRAFVLRLLQAEVPEIAGGTVQVRAIAREPGLRTKIAVSSTDPGVDAVGACVGPRGVRHRSLTAQLGKEHVDVVPYDPAPERYVAAALGPARVSGVVIDPVTRTANVRVPGDQLSLAIGHDGQNARLGAKLTGWRIDIRVDGDDAPRR